MEAPATYATQKKFVVHKHYYRLRIWQGRVGMMCDCGDWIDAAEVERRINGEA